MPTKFSYQNDSDEDQRASPEEKAKNLHDQEQQSGYDRDFDALTDPEHLKKDGVEGDKGTTSDDTGAVRDAEENGGWKSSYGGNDSKDRKGFSRANFNAVLKKRGPVAAIVTLLLGGGIGAGVFFGPSLLLVQIQESFLTSFDSQNTSLTIRTNKLLANKLVDDGTTGSCNVIKIACRFSRPSNKLLKNLERNGVLARDSNGNIISRQDGKFQTKRPATYTFRGEDISAKDFSKTLRNNAAFRSAFHKAYNPRFVGFTDAVFKKVQGRFGFDITNKDAAAGDKKTGERLNESSKGTNAVTGELAEEGSEGIIRKLLSTKAADVVGKIAKGGKGDAFGLVAASVCVVGDVPKLIISTVRAYQLVQVVNYSMQFLIAGSALKAGQITQEQATALGALLTTSVASKTAMDSFGMKYAMFGDTRAASSSYKRFIPGGSAVSAIGGVAQVLSGDIKKNTCDVATNPATGAAINVGLAVAGPETLGASLAVAAINIGAGIVVSEVVSQVGIPLIVQALKGVDVQPLLGFFLGDLTQNLAGEDVGNALTSGASNLMAQTANAGGNMPLTVDQAVAYNQSTKEVNLAYAQEDRATMSPLDPTNPNTVVGSFVGKLVPYFAGVNSVGSALKSIASLPTGSLATLINSSTVGALSAEQYSLCNDPNVTDSGVAAGPFCNVQYGIPTQYLDMDPQQVVNNLVASGDINPDTGEPVEKDDGQNLSRWINTCTDGATDELKNCQITDEKTAEYSLYIIDHRIQQSMDESSSDSSTVSYNETSTQESITSTDSTAVVDGLLSSADTIKSSLSASSYLSTSLSSTTNSVMANAPAPVSVNKPYLPSLTKAWYWLAA